jgi:signal transduction histidine kinase
MIMSDKLPANDNAEEIGGALSRVNQLGAATERMFSRLYSGLSRRSKVDNERATRERHRQELKQRIENAGRIEAENQRLRLGLYKRTVELEHLHGVLATIEEGIIMQDNEGRIVFMNKSARDLLGNQKNFWESDLGVLFNEYSHITSVSSELVPLGDPNRVQVNDRVLGAQLAAVANGDGERLGTMIVLRDVTHDALADRLKDQFATAISHELKTPMTVIKGMSEVMMGLPEGQPPNRRLMETLSRNVDILDRMVVELLDVSEMGAGAFEIRHTEINLEELLWNVVNGVEPEIQKKNMDVMLMARDVNHLRIKGDNQRLRWALGHIIQNSIYYTSPGGHIVVSAGIDQDKADHITISIIDNGVGISQKDMSHIFERFYRGDPRDVNGKLIDPRGLGQGLFIARTVAEAHSGHLTAQSDLGLGSVFTMTLPQQ